MPTDFCACVNWLPVAMSCWQRTALGWPRFSLLCGPAENCALAGRCYPWRGDFCSRSNCSVSRRPRFARRLSISGACYWEASVYSARRRFSHTDGVLAKAGKRSWAFISRDFCCWRTRTIRYQRIMRACFAWVLSFRSISLVKLLSRDCWQFARWFIGVFGPKRAFGGWTSQVWH